MLNNSQTTNVRSEIRRRRLAAAALACILLGVYLLTYRPVPDSADGLAMLAVATSFVRHGSADIEVFAATDAQFPLDAARMGARGLDGALYAKKGITPSLALLPLVALSEIVPGWSAQAAAMLLNPLVTIATALVVFSLILRLGYQLRTAVAVGLVFGLATLALPYAGTLFGEPLAGLMLLLAIAGLVERRARGMALAGLCGGLLVGVNTAYAVTLAALGVWALASVWPERNWHGLLAFGLAAAAPLLLIALYNTARFGGPMETGYRFGDGEGFTVNPLFGAYGLLLSPYKGLLWYSPVVLLSLVGWPALRRRAPALAWGTGTLVMLQVALFAAWWSWHGGVAWGPRFLLPILPLLAVWFAPVIDRSWTSRPLRVGVSVLVVLSVTVSLLGALVDYLTYFAYLTFAVWGGDFAGASAGAYDALVSDLSLSPLVGHLALALGGWPLELAWQSPFDPLTLLAGLGLMAYGVLLAVLAHQRRGSVWLGVAAPMAAIATCFVVVAAQSTLPGAAQVTALANAMQPPGVVVAETTVFGDRLIDLEAPFRVFTANAPNTPDDPDIAPLWERARSISGPLWLLTWFPACDAENWMEAALWESSAFIADHVTDNHRAVGFFTAPDPMRLAGGWQFADITLNRYGADVEPEGVLIGLEWQAMTAPDGDYQWFVHLLGTDGEIKAQQDRAPRGGCRPTNEWSAGETVTDHLYFPVAGVGEGWTLRIGWIDRAMGETLTVTGPDNLVANTPYVLIPLQNG